MTDVIYSYTLEQAIEDGILAIPFDNNVLKLMMKHVDNKPIIATAHLFGDLDGEQLLDIWDKFIKWRKEVMPTLPEEYRMFSLEVNGKKVWVDETPYQVTLMYTEDY